MTRERGVPVRTAGGDGSGTGSGPTIEVDPLVEVDPLIDVARARTGQLAGAMALDLLMPAGVAASGVIAVVGRFAVVGAVLTSTGVILVSVAAWLLGRTGRTLGTATVDIRVVCRSTGAAAGPGALIALASGRLGAYDLRRGRDPFAPALAPFVFPRAAMRSTPGDTRVRRPPTLVLDSGERLSLDAALLLGRDPVHRVGAPDRVHRWADLSRTLSKSHLRLEWDGERVWVTDLGSTNGTLVRGSDRPLPPLERTPVPTPTILEIGDRSLTVRAEER